MTKMVGITHNIQCNNSPVEIVPISDLHIGDPFCDMKLIKKMIDDIQTIPNRYCVLCGDLMNTAIAGGKSDSYGETLTPQEQLDKAVELLKPIASKILAIVPGNHEERISRSVGVDMTKTLAKLLNLETLYSPNSALVFIKFGFAYSLYINHGHGGGRRAGSKLNSLEDFAQIIDADIFIVGHTHLPASFKRVTYQIRSGKSVAVPHEQLFVNTASALQYGGYGNRNGYAPASNRYPIITLDCTQHAMTVTL